MKFPFDLFYKIPFWTPFQNTQANTFRGLSVFQLQCEFGKKKEKKEGSYDKETRIYIAKSLSSLKPI